MSNEYNPSAQPFTPEEVKTDDVLFFFQYGHLPERLQAASRPWANLSRHVIDTLPRCPERTVALRKLLEGKDAAVRAALPRKES